MKYPAYKLRIAAALCCLLLTIAPLAAQAASPDAAADGPASSAVSEECNASGMQLSRSSVTLTITSSEPNPTVKLRVSTTRSAYNYVTWSSNEVSVASVDSNGVVTAHKEGMAAITCRTNMGESATCLVVVKTTAPTLNESSLTLTKHYNDPNPTKQLYLSQGSGPLLNWYSSNPSVASVSRDGLVTALAEGKTTIGAITAEGKSVSCTVTVESDIGKVLLNKERLLLHDIGGTEALTAVMDGSSVPVVWTSSDPAVAAVSETGVVTAIASGEATITVTAENGTTAQCTVFVGQSADKRESTDNMVLALTVGGIIVVFVLGAALSGV